MIVTVVAAHLRASVLVCIMATQLSKVIESPIILQTVIGALQRMS